MSEVKCMSTKTVFFYGIGGNRCRCLVDTGIGGYCSSLMIACMFSFKWEARSSAKSKKE